MTTLSICIPTLNRLDYLRASLSGLLPIAQEMGVEVCVSDNASSDGTADFLAGLLDVYSCLKVRRFEEKQDIDSSMIAAIAMGRGEYIFPLGDDDLLETGALVAILAHLKRGQHDMVVLNGFHTDPQLRKLRPHLGKGLAGKLHHRPDTAFAELWGHMPFGSFLARAELFRHAWSGRFHGTSHAYTGMIWDALAALFEQHGKCNVSCMREPTVLLRGAEKAWKKDALEILLFQIGDWFSKVAHQSIYRQAVTRATKDYARIHLRFSQLTRYRCAGALSKGDFERLLRLWPARRVTILATMLLPASLLHLYLKRRRIDYTVTGL